MSLKPRSRRPQSPFIVAAIAQFDELLSRALGLNSAGTSGVVRHKSDGSRRAKHAAGAGTGSTMQPHLSEVTRGAVVAVLRAAALSLVPASEKDCVRQFRLFNDEFCATSRVPDATTCSSATSDASIPSPGHVERSPVVGKTSPEELGTLLEFLLSGENLRKQRGRFYTPRAVVDDVVSRAIVPFCVAGRAIPRVLDPACGGGAFLFGVARALEQAHTVEALKGRSQSEAMQSEVMQSEVTQSGRTPEATRALRKAIVQRLHGRDIEPLAVAVTELALAMWAGADQLESFARLIDQPNQSQFQRVDSLEGQLEESFELVIGNPPWVAYAGRAAQPLSAERRQWLAQTYRAFHGYPTLHACFVELAARLAAKGRIALLLPSPVADLDGYRPTRRALTQTHVVESELVEYGQDAFEDVVQPCFALIADASSAAETSDLPFPLAERTDKGALAERIEPPDVLLRLREMAPFARDCFRELGFQTTTIVTKNLLLRTSEPEPPFVWPLLEGRDVGEFHVGAPRLFLNPERDVLRRARVRLRAIEEYHAVEFVVRQTAKYTIAALHTGLSFRNTLIAGFGTPKFSAEVMVGLLNSTLIRAMHLASQRDARQKTFPQVKLSHLRSLPAPLPSAAKSAKLGQLVRGLSGEKLGAEDRLRLDAMVFDWYGVSADEARAVERFYAERTGPVSSAV